MKNNTTLCVLLLPTIFFVVLPSMVFADQEERVAVSLAGMSFDYEETDIDGTFLDGEKGDLLGLSIEYSRQLKNNMLAKLSVEYFWGSVNYDGHLQSTDNPPDPNVQMFPFQSDTNETVFSLTAYLSSRVNDSLPHLSLYGKVAYKIWGRDIQGRYVSENGNLGIPINQFVDDLYEEYRWWQITGGLEYELVLTPNSQLNFYAGVLHSLNATMQTGSYKLNLVEKPGYEAGIAWYFYIAPGKRLGISSSISYWEFGRSNAILTSSNDIILEPDSESTMKTLMVTYDWQLPKR